MTDKRKPKNRYGNWVKNFGKSTAFGSISLLKDSMPFVSNTVDNLRNNVDELKEDIMNLRNDKKRIINYLTGNDDFADNLSPALESIKKSLKSGEFITPESDDDFNPDGDFNPEIDDSDIDDMFNSDEPIVKTNGKFSDVPMGPSKIINVNGPSNGAISNLNRTMVGVGDVINKEFAKSNQLAADEMTISLALNKKYFTETSEKLSKIHDSMSSIITFNNEAVDPFLQGSLKYYDDSLKLLQEIRDSADIISRPYQEKEKAKQKEESGLFSDIYDSHSGLNIKELLKNVAGNARNQFQMSEIGGLISLTGSILGMGSGMGMNVGEELFKFALGSFMPTAITKTIERFDTSIKNFIPAILRKLGNNKEGGILGNIMSLFGIKSYARSSEMNNLNEWERGAIQYDGESKKAITEVIPSYLSKIAFTLDSIAHAQGVNGFERPPQQVIYDWSGDITTGGKFVTPEILKAQNENNKKRAATKGFQNSSYEFSSKVKNLYGFSDKSDELTEQFQNVLMEMVLKNVSIDDKEGFNSIISKKFNSADLSTIKILLDSLSDSSKMEMAGSGILSGIENLNKYNRSFNENGGIISNRNLLNNGILNPYGDSNFIGKKYLGHRSSGVEINYGFENVDDNDLHGRYSTKYTVSDSVYDKYARKNKTLTKDAIIEKIVNDTKKEIADNNSSSNNITTFETEKTKLLNDGYEKYKKEENASLSREEWIKENEERINEEAERNVREIISKKENNKDDKETGISGYIGKFIKSPLAFINKGLDRIDSFMYKAIFGDNSGDSSIFNTIISGIRNTFNTTVDFFKEKVITPFKNFVFGEDIKATEWYQALKSGIKDSLLGEKDTQGNYSNGFFSDAINGTKSFFGDLKDEWNNSIKPGISDMFDLAKQSVFGEKEEDNSREKKPLLTKIKESISEGIAGWTNVLFGDRRVDPKVSIESTNRSLSKMIPGAKKGIVAGAVGGLASGMGAFGLLGTMFLPGGPIGGAIVGGAVGMLSQMDSVKDFLFGEEKTDKDGKTERVGGIIPKGFTDWLKKNKVAVVGGGVAGIVKSALFGGVGLIPGIAVGAMGPAIAGSAWALALKSDVLREELFGKTDPDGKKIGGLLNHEVVGKMKKALPRALVGALGSVAGFSVLGELGAVGSFLALGPIPAAIAGAGIGILTASDKFNRAIFGEIDENGEYHSGLLDKTKNLFVEEIAKPISIFGRREALKTKRWFAESIVYPISDAFLPLKISLKRSSDLIIDGVTDTLKSVGKGFKDTFQLMADAIFNKINEFMAPAKYYANKLFSFAGSVLRGVGTITRFLTMAPIKALSGTAEANLIAQGVKGERAVAIQGLKEAYHAGSFKGAKSAFGKLAKTYLNAKETAAEHTEVDSEGNVIDGGYRELVKARKARELDRIERAKKWDEEENNINEEEKKHKTTRDEAILRGYKLSTVQVNDKYKTIWKNADGKTVEVEEAEEEEARKKSEEAAAQFDKDNGIGGKTFEEINEEKAKQQQLNLINNGSGLTDSQYKERKNRINRMKKTASAISELGKSQKAEDLIKHEEVNLLYKIAENTGNIFNITNTISDTQQETIEKNEEETANIVASIDDGNLLNNDDNASAHAKAVREEAEKEAVNNAVKNTSETLGRIEKGIVGADGDILKSGGKENGGGPFSILSGIRNIGSGIFGMAQTLFGGVAVLSSIAAAVHMLFTDKETRNNNLSNAFSSNAGGYLVERGIRSSSKFIAKNTIRGIKFLNNGIDNYGADFDPKSRLEESTRRFSNAEKEYNNMMKFKNEYNAFKLQKEKLADTRTSIENAKKLRQEYLQMGNVEKAKEMEKIISSNVNSLNSQIKELSNNPLANMKIDDDYDNKLNDYEKKVKANYEESKNSKKYWADENAKLDSRNANSISDAFDAKDAKGLNAKNLDSENVAKKLDACADHIDNTVKKFDIFDKLKGGKKSISNFFKGIFDRIKQSKSIQKIISTRLAKLVARTALTATGVGIVIDAAFTAYDFFSGAYNASDMFDIAPEHVDFKMRLISGFVNAICGIPLFGWIDISLSVISFAWEYFANTEIGKLLTKFGITISGVDHRKWLAQLLYSMVADGEDSEALTKNQNDIKNEYQKYLTENNKTSEEVTFEEYKNDIRKSPSFWDKYGSPLVKNIFGIEDQSTLATKDKPLVDQIKPGVDDLTTWFNGGVKSVTQTPFDEYFRNNILGGSVPSTYNKVKTRNSGSFNLNDNFIADGEGDKKANYVDFSRYTKKNKDNEIEYDDSFSGGGDIDPTAKQKKLNENDKGIPYYWEQTDPNLANKPVLPFDSGYGSFKDFGCAPTALSMVASMYNNAPIDPVQASYLIQKDDVSYGDGFFGNTIKGIKSSYFSNAAPNLGLNMTKIPFFGPHARGIMDYLYKGNAVILGGKSSSGPKEGITPFTKTGHYVVVAGVDKENPKNVYVYDPLGRSGLYDAQELYDSASGITNGGFAAAFNMGSESPYKVTYKGYGPSGINRTPNSSENAPILPPTNNNNIGLRDLGKYNNGTWHKFKDNVTLNGLHKETKDAIEYLGKYFAWLTDGTYLLITSTKNDFDRKKNPKSRHNDGWCFDCTEDFGDQHHEFDDEELRYKFIEEASRVGVYVYDEYANSSGDKTANHLHCDCEKFLKEAKPIPSVSNRASKSTFSFLDLISNLGADITSLMEANMQGRLWNPDNPNESSTGTDSQEESPKDGTFNPNYNEGQNEFYRKGNDYYEDGVKALETMPRTERIKSLDFGEKEKNIARYLRKHGYDNGSIAGILGNIKQENTSFDPAINNQDIGSDGYPMGGLGLFQWNDTRKTAAFNYAKKHGKNIYDTNTQLDYMMEESNGEFYPVHRDKLNGVNPARFTAWKFGAEFEKGTMLGRRQGYADRYYQMLSADSEFSGAGNGTMSKAVDRYARANSQPKILHSNNKTINDFRDNNTIQENKSGIKFINNRQSYNINISELVHAIEDINSKEELKEVLKYLKVIAINGAVSNQEQEKPINPRAPKRNTRPIATKIRLNDIKKMINTNSTLGNLERDAVSVAVEIAKGGSFRNI